MVHDPTTPDRQGDDVGSSYRSAIFYHDAGQKKEALAMAREFMQIHLEHMPGWEGTCEVRAFATP